MKVNQLLYWIKSTSKSQVHNSRRPCSKFHYKHHERVIQKVLRLYKSTAVHVVQISIQSMNRHSKSKDCTVKCTHSVQVLNVQYGRILVKRFENYLKETKISNIV